MGLTFLAVHAHPDDEASSTGGVYRVLADQGVRTVLVTCTNGEFGDAPGGIKPGEEGHAEDEVVRIREGELDRAVEVLGISRLIRLGYRDSGMMGWPQNDDPKSFWATPVNEAAVVHLNEVLVIDLGGVGRHRVVLHLDEGTHVHRRRDEVVSDVGPGVEDERRQGEFDLLSPGDEGGDHSFGHD